MKNIEKFITVYGQAIADSCDGTGLFPSVLMAQIIQESSGNYGEYGLSYLAYKYNNYAGIKAWAGYTGSTVDVNTGEHLNGKDVVVKDKFCYFKDLADFIKWRKVFLTRNSRYSKFGVFDAKTPLQQIQALKNAGYATDPNYVSRVNSHIVANRLTRLDDLLKKKV